MTVTTVHIATVLASALSGLALIVCFIVAPMIYAEVQSIWRELEMEIDDFKVTTDFSYDDSSWITGSKYEAWRDGDNN